ncbi:MAG TPA: ANTAR domain-containing protein, partial [Pilimelia sp.]|nr:ANTAR domain-containing protein [Pilimelia sp.]
MSLPRKPTAAPELSVARLRREVAQLRRELREQRTIGPAVGVLAARLGTDPEQARARLVELARAYGVPLAEAAAAVLAARGSATAEPLPAGRVSAVLDTGRILARSAGRQLDRPDRRTGPAVPGPAQTGAGAGGPGIAEVTAGDGGTALAVTIPAEFDALAEALCEQLTEHLGPTAVGLLALEPDGSLRFAGSAGIPSDTVAAWRRIPARFNTAVADVARGGRARWLPRLDEARRRYAMLGEPEIVWPSRAALPLRDANRVVGVAAIYCPTTHQFEPATRRAVSRLVTGVAPRFAELLRLYPEQALWVAETQALLDMLPGAVALGIPIQDAEGRIVDYRIAAASPGAVDLAGRRGRELVGLRVLEAYPSLEGGELIRAYAQVIATGQAREIGPFPYSEGAATEAMYSVTAYRYRDGLLVNWLRHDEDQRYADRLARTERLGNLGWVEWDLTTNTQYWSDQVYEIFDRDPAAGPASLEEIGARILSEDLPTLEAAVTALLGERRSMDLTYRIRVHGDLRFVRSMIEAVHDERGRPVRAYGIVQDVTGVEAADRDRRRLVAIERQLAERQRTLQTEHRLVAALQQIILP